MVVKVVVVVVVVVEEEEVEPHLVAARAVGAGALRRLEDAPRPVKRVVEVGRARRAHFSNPRLDERHIRAGGGHERRAVRDGIGREVDDRHVVGLRQSVDHLSRVRVRVRVRAKVRGRGRRCR